MSGGAAGVTGRAFGFGVDATVSLVVGIGSSFDFAVLFLRVHACFFGSTLATDSQALHQILFSFDGESDGVGITAVLVVIP
jgi:hypothetical protein